MYIISSLVWGVFQDHVYHFFSSLRSVSGSCISFLLQFEECFRIMYIISSLVWGVFQDHVYHFSYIVCNLCFHYCIFRVKCYPLQKIKKQTEPFVLKFKSRLTIQRYTDIDHYHSLIILVQCMFTNIWSVWHFHCI
jgi:hypothetical protein